MKIINNTLTILKAKIESIKKKELYYNICETTFYFSEN